jgi:hypothetical protein
VPFPEECEDVVQVCQVGFDWDVVDPFTAISACGRSYADRPPYYPRHSFRPTDTDSNIGTDTRPTPTDVAIAVARIHSHGCILSWYHSGKIVDFSTTEFVDINRLNRADQPFPSTGVRQGETDFQSAFVGPT